ncbi:MAG: heme o synthase [Fuerstiella sp.]
MSIATPPVAADVRSDAADLRLSLVLRQRISDYAEISRPRIAVMTMISVAVGFTLASPVVFQGTTLLVALVGIVQLVAASSILNQCLERGTDARMQRTSERPLVTGRLPISEAVVTALALSVCGTWLLSTFVNIATAAATLATLATYVLGYTLLKPRTSLCTTIGAIPGAMPPVLGWLAAGGSFGIEALALFGVFFVWQFPHFLAIGWIHRDDYRQAGLRMLPSFTDKGLLTGLLAVIYAAAFIPISVLPAAIGLSGDIYFLAALVFSTAYLVFSCRFLLNRSRDVARQLLLYSLLCLPLLLLALVLDFLRLTSVG